MMTRHEVSQGLVDSGSASSESLSSKPSSVASSSFATAVSGQSNHEHAKKSCTKSTSSHQSVPPLEVNVDNMSDVSELDDCSSIACLEEVLGQANAHNQFSADETRAAHAENDDFEHHGNSIMTLKQVQ